MDINRGIRKFPDEERMQIMRINNNITALNSHKQYGINKFIIAVPSLAVKAGTSQFLNENYVRRHFKDV